MKNFYGTLIKSDNALLAEENGLVTISKVTKPWLLNAISDFEKTTQERDLWISKIAKLKTEDIKEIAKLSHNGEWHHIGKFASKIKYYDYRDILKWIAENDITDLKKTSEECESLVCGTYIIWGGSFKSPRKIGTEEFKNGRIRGEWII